MKLLLACIILLASPLQAQVGGNCAVIDCPSNFMPQPVPPSATARLKVLAALAKINIAETSEIVAAEDLEKRAKQIKAELAKNIPWYKPWEVITDGAIKTATLSDPEYLRRMVKHQSAVAANYKAHNDAILEASKAFQLFPPVGDFTGDPRASGLNMVAKPWLPRYSRHEKRDDKTGQWRKRTKEELDRERADNAIVGGGVMSARTRGNGVMEFYGEAFDNPEDLAILIYHETSHWVDIAGKSGGHMLSDPPAVSFRTEQHAYERAAAFALKLNADPSQHLKMAKQFELQATQSEDQKLTWPLILVHHRDWIGKDREGQLALAPSESEISPGDEALLQAKMAEAQKLVMENREYLEIIAELRRQAAAAAPPIELHPIIPGTDPPGRIRAVPTQPGGNGAIALNPSQPRIAEMQLKDIAERACASPPQAVDRELAAVDWGLFQRERDVERYADGLSACERRVVLRLIELGRAWRPGVVIGADAVRAAASDSGSVGVSVPPSRGCEDFGNVRCP